MSTAEEKLEQIRRYAESKPRSSVARAILKQWFSATGYSILAPATPELTVDGHFFKEFGIYYGAWEADQDWPREFRKINAKNHRADNARLMLWDGNEALPTDSPAIIEDCVFEHAAASPPKSRDGTAESNLWIGMRAIANRVICRDGAWMGLWIGGDGPTKFNGAYGTIIRNLQCLDQEIGIYFEHVSHNVDISNFLIRARDIGVKTEWWYENRGSADCKLSNFDISITGNPDKWDDRNGWGISLDAGTGGFQIGPGIIRGGKGIELPFHIYPGYGPNVVKDVIRPDGSPVPVVYHDRPIGD